MGVDFNTTGVKTASTVSGSAQGSASATDRFGIVFTAKNTDTMNAKAFRIKPSQDITTPVTANFLGTPFTNMFAASQITATLLRY